MHDLAFWVGTGSPGGWWGSSSSLPSWAVGDLFIPFSVCVVNSSILLSLGWEFLHTHLYYHLLLSLFLFACLSLPPSLPFLPKEERRRKEEKEGTCLSSSYLWARRTHLPNNMPLRHTALPGRQGQFLRHGDRHGRADIHACLPCYKGTDVPGFSHTPTSMDDGPLWLALHFWHMHMQTFLHFWHSPNFCKTFVPLACLENGDVWGLFLTYVSLSI